MPLVNDRCICLRKTEYSETSQILTLFSREYGIFRTIAKGAHRRTKAGASKFGGGVDFLEVGDAVFIHDPAKDLCILTEWTLREGHLELRNTLRGMYLGLYAGELVGRLIEEHDPHPELFDRVIFVCPRSEPTGLDLPRWAAPIRHFMISAPGLGQGYYEAAAGEYALVRYLRNSFHNPKEVTAERVKRLHYNAWRAGSIHAFAGLCVGYVDWPLLDSLPRVQNPILLVWGRQARPTPVEHSVRLVALARRCNLRVIENAGAWVHDERSAQVNKLVESYLEGKLAEAPRAVTA